MQPTRTLAACFPGSRQAVAPGTTAVVPSTPHRPHARQEMVHLSTPGAWQVRTHLEERLQVLSVYIPREGDRSSSSGASHLVCAACVGCVGTFTRDFLRWCDILLVAHVLVRSARSSACFSCGPSTGSSNSTTYRLCGSSSCAFEWANGCERSAFRCSDVVATGRARVG